MASPHVGSVELPIHVMMLDGSAREADTRAHMEELGLHWVHEHALNGREALARGESVVVEEGLTLDFTPGGLALVKADARNPTAGEVTLVDEEHTRTDIGQKAGIAAVAVTAYRALRAAEARGDAALFLAESDVRFDAPVLRSMRERGTTTLGAVPADAGLVYWGGNVQHVFGNVLTCVEGVDAFAEPTTRKMGGTFAVLILRAAFPHVLAAWRANLFAIARENTAKSRDKPLKFHDMTKFCKGVRGAGLRVLTTCPLVCGTAPGAQSEVQDHGTVDRLSQAPLMQPDARSGTEKRLFAGIAQYCFTAAQVARIKSVSERVLDFVTAQHTDIVLEPLVGDVHMFDLMWQLCVKDERPADAHVDEFVATLEGVLRGEE